VLEDVKRAEHVDRESPCELVRRVLADRGDRSADTGVTEENVEAAVALNALRDCAHDRRLVGDVGDRGQRVLVAQVRDRSVELVPVEAHEVHASALRNEQPRGGESDAALPACNERHLVGKTSHTPPPSIETSIAHVRAADAPLTLSRA
jgi:hypothetical protein